MGATHIFLVLRIGARYERRRHIVVYRLGQDALFAHQFVRRIDMLHAAKDGRIGAHLNIASWLHLIQVLGRHEFTLRED